MLDIEQRATLLLVAVERGLAEDCRTASSGDVIAALEGLLLSDDKPALFQHWINERRANPVRYSIRTALATEILANRLPRLNDCLTLALSELIAGRFDIIERYRLSGNQTLQRVADVVSGNFVISDEAIRRAREIQERLERRSALQKQRDRSRRPVSAKPLQSTRTDADGLQTSKKTATLLQSNRVALSARESEFRKAVSKQAQSAVGRTLRIAKRLSASNEEVIPDEFTNEYVRYLYVKTKHRLQSRVGANNDS